MSSDIKPGILLSVFLCSLIALVLRIHSRRRRGGKGGRAAPPPTPSWQVVALVTLADLFPIIWQVTGGEGELEWPAPLSFVLPPARPLQPPPARPPSTQLPPPYLGLPADTGYGASALINRPVDYPTLYKTHQNPLTLTSFPSSLALNTATTASDTVNLTNPAQVKRSQLKPESILMVVEGEEDCQPRPPSSSLASSSSSSHSTSAFTSFPAKATDAGLTKGNKVGAQMMSRQGLRETT